ncbi:hypothetical protein [Pseudomonas segetis]|uniref:Bacteriophage Rz lysis protein n=1 Tax=Pseudomonas segetis TaxID=298908 RepID=A0A239JRG4_9PSED|nr:hypothetical protein [Pseudomonas segetis]SNT07364.1 hypothetical protein SAMN05216255_4429 [Pseudomonas segetis]
MKWIDYLRPFFPLALLLSFVVWVNYLESAAFDDGFSQAKAEGALALEKLRGDHQAQELERAKTAEASAKDAAKRLQQVQAQNDKLTVDLANQRRTYRKTTDQLIGEIARVNDLYRKALDAEPEPLPACVLTRGWVRVYDQATGAILPSPVDSSGAVTQSAESRAIEQLDSGIGSTALLAHHVRYAEQCKSTAAQLDALIDVVQGTP